MKLEDLKRFARLLQLEDSSRNSPLLREQLRELGLDPDRLYQELEMSARYAQAHRDTSNSNATVHLHSHSFYEILCCRNTCGAEYLVGTGRYRLRKGDIILVPPGVSHRPLLPESMPQPYVRDVLWISEEFVRSIRRLFPAEELPAQMRGSLLRAGGTKWEFLAQLIRSCVLETEGGAPNWEVVVMGHAMALMTHLKRALQDSETLALPLEQPGILDRALGIIEENLSEKITLEDIARRLYVSESTVSHIFRQKMGVSFYRCVTQRRLISAKVLILEGLPLEAVAARVGFSDYSGFYRAFRQEYGISPREYRRLQEQAAQP